MNVGQWFHRYARWDVVGWLVIVAIGAFWEIEGLFVNRTTFTDLVRASVPTWLRAAALGWLVYHFLIDPINYK